MEQEKKFTNLNMGIGVALFVIIAIAGYMLLGFTIEYLIYLCALSPMIVMAIQDIKEHYFSNEFVWLMLAFGIILIPTNPFVSLLNVLLGVALLGGGMAGLSVITKGQIGMGDAKLFAILALYFGAKSAFMILMYSLILSAIVSLVLITVKRAGRKTEIPFVPFIALGVIVELFMKF
jgi:Flp pilus assembly protein protease CpaA